jgi:hypothetical protein
MKLDLIPLIFSSDTSYSAAAPEIFQSSPLMLHINKGRSISLASSFSFVENFSHYIVIYTTVRVQNSKVEGILYHTTAEMYHLDRLLLTKSN